MKKQVIVALALSVSAFSFAQKKELKTAEKALKKNNYAEAKTALGQVEGMLSSMDDKYKEQYYYLNAEALYANGAGSDADIDMALKSLSNVNSKEADELKQAMLQSFLTKGNDAYEKKDLGNASIYFEKAYRASTKDTTYLYYSASAAVQGQDFDRALPIYEELRDLGYTGIQTEYFAANKETGVEESFPNKELRDASVKSGTHIKPSDRQSQSRRAEIVKNIALIYVGQGNDQKAIEAMDEARKANPEDISLLITEANINFKMGNTAEFKRLLEEATQKDPNNAELQYNLGVVSAETGDVESAKKFYQKAISLDPSYVNAQINMAALILGEEQKIVSEMNNLGTSAADNKRYDELKEERMNLYREAIPYLEGALKVDPTNLQAAKTLLNIYVAIGDTQNENKMKAKVAELEAGN
ncbi:tetratricopeptide repeat protein [Mangrovimonas aestuarii]|uniref:tetratricopeptide repeat protein n=1 Tax=Mangrovimonas aestuarii TaxID=3018443 RepID=UPI0023798005|nr:tetratricopeptide repeat protein [Mangrovimonas aestuarii]